MAFVRGYTHDVFISYAHADDRPFVGADKGWVTAFAADLNTALSQRLRGDAELWMDFRELKGNTALTPAIMRALRETATFVVVVSPRYLASEWCQREREAFLQLVRERSAAGWRMFKVELDSVEGGGGQGRKTPAAFNDLIGYKFWEKEWHEPVPRTLGWPLPNPQRDQVYYDRIKALSYELAEELERINGERWDGDSPEAEPKTTVYLAEVTDDLDGKREKIKAYLKQSGIGVLPETWRSYEDLDGYQNAVDTDLARCRLFVQLLSDVTGKRPFRQPLGCPRLQYERAKQAGMNVLQWRSEATEVEEADDDQRALLEGFTVRAEAFEEFKKAVVKAATPPDPPPLARPTPNAGKFVFVSTDTTDRSRAEEVVCDSLRRRGINYAMPPSSGDPEVARKFLELSLTNCDAALVIYCETDIATVFSQTLQCRKVIAQRQEPLPFIAVFDAPPPSERDPLPFSFDNLIHLNCRQDPSALERFLDSL